MLDVMSKLEERMMFRLHDDLLIFVPAFISSESEDDLLQYYIIRTIYTIEFIALAISLPVAVLHNYCLSRSTFFHPNLIRIAQVFLAGHYFSVASRIILFLYQSEIIRYDANIPSSMYTLIVASIIRLWFLMTTMGILGEMIAERKFAYFFVADYEKNHRLWISTVLLILSRAVTLTLAFAIMLRLFPYFCMIACSCISVSVSVFTSALMYRQNRIKLLELRSGAFNARTINTISVKFQLIENARVMKLVMIAFSIAGVVISLGLLLLVLSFYVYSENPRKAQVYFALLDLLVALSTAGGFFAFLLIISESRRILRDCVLVRVLFPRFANRIFSPWRNGKIDNHRGASKQYFDQLKMAWERGVLSSLDCSTLPSDIA